MSAPNVYVYKSTDTGAPSLTGQAGSGVALLDACLVNGFNPRSVTGITRSGTTATATTSAAHGYKAGDAVAISGADQADYTGTFTILSVTTTAFTFTVANTATTPATGSSMAAKRAPAGWSKVYSGTNRGAYKAPSVAGTGFLLRADDTGSLTAQGARNMYVRGYEIMSDIDNGLGLFPTVGAETYGRNWRKSSTLDSTARPWALYVSDRHIWLFIGWSATDAATAIYAPNPFGDLGNSRRAGDHYACWLGGSTSDTFSSGYLGENNLCLQISNVWNVGQGSYAQANGEPVLARNYSGLGTPTSSGGGSTVCGLIGDQSVFIAGNANNQAVGQSGLAWPDALHGGTDIAELLVAEYGQIRGKAPGVYQPCHAAPFSNFAQDAGYGALPGRTLEAIKVNSTYYQASLGGTGQVLIDLTGPWHS